MEREPQPLPCVTILYRSVTRRDWLQPDSQHLAFLLRQGETDLSTWRNTRAAWLRLKGVKHVWSLHTGRVRTLKAPVAAGSTELRALEVLDDPDDEEHASIRHLPSPYESHASFQAASRLAEELLEMSRPVPPLPAEG